MGSMVNPKPWVPYMNTRDCSQGFCSLYCPQWCYITFPPPPPFELPDDSPGPSFSPIVIAIIGILASAFLLVSYYAIISKYCKDRDSSSSTTRTRGNQNQFPVVESDENQDHGSNHAPWHNLENGLDEALIKSIQVFKYKKGAGLIEGGTDCSVCLSEFQDDENLRLLPKCSHAFHVICIDTWFKSHSNCPLCRSNIALLNALPPLTETETESPAQNDPPIIHSNPEIENVASEDDLEMGIRDGESHNNTSNSEAQSSLIDTRNDEESGAMQIRRSVSMDCICRGRLSIADVLRIDQDEDEDEQIELNKLTNDGAAGASSKWAFVVGMNRTTGNMTRMLHCVSGPIINRSFSSGRFLFSKAGNGNGNGRGRNLEIPL